MGNPYGLDRETLMAWASGVVVAQTSCTVEEAVALMQERAAQTSRTVEAVADDVINRTIRFNA